MSAAKPEETIRQLKRRLWIERGCFLVVLLGLVGWWAYPLLFPSVWAVYVADKPIVAMRDRAAVVAALDQAKRAQAGSTAGVGFTQPVRIARASPDSVEITDPDTAVERLTSSLSLKAVRAVIYVDETPAVALPDEAQAQEVLDRLKADFAAKVTNLESAPTFQENVELRVEPASQETWADVETAIRLLRGEDVGEKKTHTVAEGETAGEIAGRYHLRLRELRRLNPTVNMRLLRVGQKLSITPVPEPVVTVLTVGTVTKLAPIPFSTRVRRSPQMFVGKRLVLRPGIPGAQRITFRVRAENGIVVDQKVASRQRLHEPQDMVVVEGSRRRS